MKKEIISAVLAALIAAGSALGVALKTTDKPVANKPTYTSVHIVYDDVEYTMSLDEWDAVFRTVMTEAGGEPYVGQQAVAQCILNTCKLTGMRPIEVIKSYKYACGNKAPTESVKLACIDVFKYGVRVLPETVTMFYSPANMQNGTSRDHEAQIYSTTIGGHKFFVERRNKTNGMGKGIV